MPHTPPNKSENNSSLPWRSVHFIGIGGAGMFGLALITQQLRTAVSGSDMADSEHLQQLRTGGASIFLGHKRENLPPVEAAVFSSAVPEDNPELTAARERGIPCYRRGHFLSLLAEYYDTVIAIAGSHGKTTTTAMLTHILKSAGLAPGYLIGGDVSDWSAPAAAGKNLRILVTEVDESDATQALIKSDYGLITNIEDDHCWNVGGEEALYKCFTDFADKAETVFTWEDQQTRDLLSQHPNVIFLQPEQELFSILKETVPGHHNQLNAALAMAAADRLGVSKDSSVKALADFPGVERRMSIRYSSPDLKQVIIEDYAHHPTELEAILKTVRRQWPEHQLTAIFQPHRFERVKRYTHEFSRLLEAHCHAAAVFRPFSAWVADQELADPKAIADNIKNIPRCYVQEEDFQVLAEKAVKLTSAQQIGRPALFLVLGAGDVNRAIPPLRNLLARQWLCNLREQLRETFPALHLDFSRAWAELTTLGIGTAAPLLAEPSSTAELREIAGWLNSKKVPFFILGNGSNLVGADNYLPCLVIKLKRGEFSQVETAGDRVNAGAGVKLPKLIDTLMSTGPIAPDFAPLGWIPASLGGAARMNAGSGSSSLGDFVESIEGVDATGELFKMDAETLQWQYRQVNLPPDAFITRIGLRFAESDTAEARRKYEEAGKKRHAGQPPGRTAGCVFRNPGETSAGELLQCCGLQGKQEGDCQISRTHANFFVNLGNCREKDFLRLAKLAVRQTYQQTSIRLIPEVCMVDLQSAGELAGAVPPLVLTVLAGGPSSEHEVSLKSGEAVADGLRQAGHKVTLTTFTKPELPPLSPFPEAIFPALHGEFGEDGQVQALLETAGIPYVGSGPEASRLMIDKAATKEVLSAAGIPTPPWRIVSDVNTPPPEASAFPLIIKPQTEGSSVGVALVEEPGEQWRRALRQAFHYCQQILVEKHIPGREITVAVLFGRSLPPIEIVPPSGRWFDFDAKYQYRHGRTEYLCPPRSIDPDIQHRCRELALRAWHELAAKDMARFDFIVDEEGTPWCLEVNTIPGFTQTSLLPRAARAASIGFAELCASLIHANLA